MRVCECASGPPEVIPTILLITDEFAADRNRERPVWLSTLAEASSTTPVFLLCASVSTRDRISCLREVNCAWFCVMRCNLASQ